MNNIKKAGLVKIITSSPSFICFRARLNKDILEDNNLNDRFFRAAVLGAPLAHDFCVISLSDRLTPWAVIEKRLACAAAGDFCLALYNPSSKGRADYLQKAVRILRDNGKGPDTVCGLVRCIGRDGQTARLLTLAELEDTAVDMFTTVFVGNAATQILHDRMVTPGVSRRMNVVIFSGTQYATSQT